MTCHAALSGLQYSDLRGYRGVLELGWTILGSYIFRYEPQNEISNNVVCATSKASDQPAHSAVWSEPLLVAWIFYDCLATDWTSFGVSKLKRRLHRLVWVYTCKNTTLLEITCHGSYSRKSCFMAPLTCLHQLNFWSHIQGYASCIVLSWIHQMDGHISNVHLDSVEVPSIYLPIMCGSRGSGPPPPPPPPHPLENYKNIGFLSIILVRSGSPEKSQNCQASIQCWAIIGPPGKRH